MIGRVLTGQLLCAAAGNEPGTSIKRFVRRQRRVRRKPDSRACQNAVLLARNKRRKNAWMDGVDQPSLEVWRNEIGVFMRSNRSAAIDRGADVVTSAWRA